ncbi:SRPBCC family protein [Verrucomicrobiaceae bacterium 227]
MSKEKTLPAGYRSWHVIRTVELGATAEEIWEVVGGFYNIHLWHPDISMSEIPADQTETRHLRRELTFPGQPITVEQLVSMDNADFHYHYKWHKGPWGEEVKNYKASIRVLQGDLNQSCHLQWASTFDHPTDAISEFYLNGFRELAKRFPLEK